MSGEDKVIAVLAGLVGIALALLVVALLGLVIIIWSGVIAG